MISLRRLGVIELTLLVLISMSRTGAAQESAAPAPPPRTLLLGDSNMHGGLGRYLDTSLKILGLDVMRRGKPTSGLARPDFFDWQEEARAILDLHRPEVVIMVFGGNDGQALSSLEPNVPLVKWRDEAAWRAEYGARMRSLMALLRGEDRRVFFLSPPNRKSPNARAKMERIVSVQREVVGSMEGVGWVDLWRLTSDDYGRFLEAGVDARGRWKIYRKGDGIHLTGPGSREVGRRLVEELLDRGLLSDRASSGAVEHGKPLTVPGRKP